MVDFVVITHGDFGAYLVEAAEEIVGRQPAGIKSVSISSRAGLADVKKKVARIIAERAPGHGLIVAVDMPGGTPANVAIPIAKDLPDVRVVSGINLYMLVSAFRLRTAATLDAVVGSMLADGQKSIRDMKAALGVAT